MTRHGCPSPAEFADFLAGCAPELNDHVHACSRCSALAAALQDARDTIPDLDAVVADIAVALRSAAVAVAELESSRPIARRSIAAEDARLHSDAGVQKLLAAAHRAYSNWPNRALEFAQIAVSIAEGRADARVRFTALKDLATFTFRVANNVEEALRLLASAAGELDAITPSHRNYFAGVLSYTKAFIYGDAACGRWDEALSELDRCEPVFRECDQKRWRASRQLRGAVLIRDERLDEAAEIYTSLLADESNAVSRAALEATSRKFIGGWGALMRHWRWLIRQLRCLQRKEWWMLLRARCGSVEMLCLVSGATATPYRSSKRRRESWLPLAALMTNYGQSSAPYVR